MQIVCLLNPAIGSKYLIRIFEELEESKQKIPEFLDYAMNHPDSASVQKSLVQMRLRLDLLHSEWIKFFGYFFASLLFYSCLYIFLERVKRKQ